MALYDYVCSECNQVSELNKPISDRDLVENDECKNCGTIGKLSRCLSSPLVGYSTVVSGGYGSKVPEGFKEVLNKVHKASPGSHLDKSSRYI